MKKTIKITPELCNGCRICTMACSLHKSGLFNPYNTGIWIDTDEATYHNTPNICRQCRNPVCVKACPAEKSWNGKAPFDPPIYRDEETGIIHLDSSKETCLGCNECMNACPFGAIRLVPETMNLVKCDLCDGDPECVKSCPKGVLEFANITKITSGVKKKAGKVL